MRIVINDEELEEHVINVLKEIPGNKVLIDHFLDGAIEAEIDAICDGENVQLIGMMEHIEPAGIHSGDSFAVLPPSAFSALLPTSHVRTSYVTLRVGFCLFLFLFLFFFVFFVFICFCFGR